MRSRWIIFVPVAILALWSTVAKADGLGNWTASKSCQNSGSVEVVNNSILITGPDGNGCSGQAHWTKIETIIPEGVNSVSFDWSYWTYDGAYYDPPQYGVNGIYTQLTMSNQASGSLTVPVTTGDIFVFRQYSIDTCCQPGHLTISNLSLWEFTTTSTTSTTTTTTTVPETTVPVTNPTTTTVPETTTTSTSTTTSTTTTTSSTTTTTTTSSTLPAPVETYAPTTLPETTTSTTTTTVALTTTTTTLLPQTTTTTIEVTTTTEAPVESSTTVAPNLEPNLDLLDEVKEIAPEQAVVLATSPQVLLAATPQQAVQIFQSLDVAELTNEEKQAVIEAVQSAPTEVRQAFEDTIDIFSDDFGDYVPLGSTVPVNTRRTLIAVAAGATTMAVSSRRR